MINNLLTVEEARYISGESIEPDAELHNIMNRIIKSAGNGKTYIKVDELGVANKEILIRLGYNVYYDKESHVISWAGEREFRLEEVEELYKFIVKAIIVTTIIMVCILFIAIMSVYL
jgi:hypothetical protein